MRTSSIRPEKYSPQIELPPILSTPFETSMLPVVAWLPTKEWEIRGEVRFDKSDQSAFLKSDGVTPTNDQHSVGVEVLYKF